MEFNPLKMTPSVKIYDPDETIEEEPLRVKLVPIMEGIQLRADVLL